MCVKYLAEDKRDSVLSEEFDQGCVIIPNKTKKQKYCHKKKTLKIITKSIKE